IVADDVAGAVDLDSHLRILVGANALDDVTLGERRVLEENSLQEPAYRSVLDRDVLAIKRMNAMRRGSEASAEAAQLEAVEIDDDVIGLNIDGDSGNDVGRQVVGEAVDTLDVDHRRDRRDRRAVHGLGEGSCSAQYYRRHNQQRGEEPGGSHMMFASMVTGVPAALSENPRTSLSGNLSDRRMVARML